MPFKLRTCLFVFILNGFAATPSEAQNTSEAARREDVSGGSTALAVSYLVVSLLVALSNATVVYVIVNTKALQQPNLWVIANMALWDLLQGLAYLVFVVPSAFVNEFIFPNSMISWVACLFSFLTGMTLFNTVTIITDRFISLKNPYVYRQIATKRNYCIGAICVVLLALARMLIIAFPDTDFYFSAQIAMCVSDFNTIPGVLASIGIVFFALCLILVCSCSVICLIYRSKRRVHNVNTGFLSKNVIKLSVMTTLSALIFCLSYLPIALGVILNLALGKDGGEETDWFSRFAVLSLLSNSIWNVVIYSANSQPFRESLLKIFCRSYHRRRNQIQVEEHHVASMRKP